MVLARKGDWEKKPPDLLHDHWVPLGLVFKNSPHFALPELRLLRKAGREGLLTCKMSGLSKRCCALCSQGLSPLSLHKSWLPGEWKSQHSLYVPHMLLFLSL